MKQYALYFKLGSIWAATAKCMGLHWSDKSYSTRNSKLSPHLLPPKACYKTFFLHTVEVITVSAASRLPSRQRTFLRLWTLLLVEIMQLKQFSEWKTRITFTIHVPGWRMREKFMSALRADCAELNRQNCRANNIWIICSIVGCCRVHRLRSYGCQVELNQNY